MRKHQFYHFIRTRLYEHGEYKYKYFRAGDGNRTHVFCLEGRCTTTVLHPLIFSFLILIIYYIKANFSKNFFGEDEKCRFF